MIAAKIPSVKIFKNCKNNHIKCMLLSILCKKKPIEMLNQLTRCHIPIIIVAVRTCKPKQQVHSLLRGPILKRTLRI